MDINIEISGLFFSATPLSMCPKGNNKADIQIFKTMIHHQKK